MRFLIIITAGLIICALSGLSEGAGKKISQTGNKHNFSYTNISVNYRAIPSASDNPIHPESAQICVFCHTPHGSSTEGPLWNRRATTKTFKHFSSPTLSIDDPALRATSEYGQPNGSSRLCLSCHDGVTALGALFTTPNIHFTDVRGGRSGADVAITYETFSSHHPVSFRYNTNVISILNAPPYSKQYKYPPLPYNVRLDKLERMQCTTCHDPHQDQSDVPSPTTPFWTAGKYEDVCLACHNVSPGLW
jgi:doubled CXXCH motif protein